MALYTKCVKTWLLLTPILRTQRFSLMKNGFRILQPVDYRLTRTSFQALHTNVVMFKQKTREKRVIQYPPKAKGEFVDVWVNMTVGELAKVLNESVQYASDILLNEYKGANTIIDDMRKLQGGIKRSGRRIRIVGNPNKEVKADVDRDVYQRPAPSKDLLKPRPPVVTVMGHVDHGKTTLLDALRNTNVVAGEFGGITQHIGAFSVKLKSGAEVTFLDTPGHAAFTSMRERGANITDIVVLVVAADDGVMEQTVESIRMAKRANVPIIVAINKIDAPKADIKRTEEMLVQNGIQVESMGGDVQAVPISALKKKNLEQLTEALAVQAEVMDIGGDPTGDVEAVVVESKVHQHRGRLCTVVVERGTLKKGDILVAGTAFCKVRALKDAEGNNLKEVKPGYPAEIEGWKDLPPAGEIVLQVDSEKRARQVIDFRAEKNMQEKMKEDAVAIKAKEDQHNIDYQEKLKLKRSLGKFKLKADGPRQKQFQEDDGSPKLNLIIKADVDGTLEAVLNTLDTYDDGKCEMDLVHYGVGAITESDIEMAHTFNAIIYAFNVEMPKKIEDILEKDASVTVKNHNVIYKLVDDVKSELDKRLPPVEVEEEIGEATVLQQFDINEGRKKVPVAGCRCVKGILKRAGLFKLKRNDEVVFDGMLSSMRHLKNEVDSIKKDTDCGLQLADKSISFQPGDVLVCYEKRSVPQHTTWDPGF